MRGERTIGALALAAWVALPGAAASAEPYRPSNEAEVLQRLTAKVADPAARDTALLRARLSENPHDVDLALRLATRYIELGRTQGDPRYAGYAQAALAPWWSVSSPPVPVQVLKATIAQNLHQFDAALADLDDALTRAPRHARARLTRATVYRVLGRYADAKRDCLQLLRTASELVAVTCAAELGSLTGQADQAHALLASAVERAAGTSGPERIWALTTLAEMAARMDQAGRADRYFREALRLDRRDGYLLGSYADFLLDQGRAVDVVTLLRDSTQADALLLRLTLAERRLHLPQASEHVAALAARFAAARLRGDTLHRREQARFTLECLKQPRQALALALANWAVQKEPADAEILLDSARAAGDPHAAQPVLAWLQDNRVEDVRLHRSARLLQRIAP